MAPRKGTKKQPKQTQPRPRQQTPERTPSPPPRNRDPEPAYRSLRAVNKLSDVLGFETDDSTGVAGSEIESYRDSTSQSRPNFSFLPSHKHSSPHRPGGKQARYQRSPETVHRLASMSTVPNTGLDDEDAEPPRPSTSQRRPASRNERDETSSSISTTVSSTLAEDTRPGPSSKGRKQTSRSTRAESASNNSQVSSSSSNSSSSQQQHQSTHSQGRKQKAPKHMHVLKEIYRQQGNVDNLIPKLSFGRVIREVLAEYSHTQLRVTPTTLQCLHEAAEAYVIQLFSDSYRCTLHRERVTLMPKDIKLALMLRGE